MMPLASRTLLAALLLSFPMAHAQSAAGDTVSVPIANGDSATVTGMLAVRHRGTKQFIVLESPTPYRLMHDQQSGASTGRIIRDIPIHLAGHDSELTSFSGKTVTATGRLQFQPTSTSWNGALLESSVVVLPGGKELRAHKR